MNDTPRLPTEDAWDNRELGATDSFVRKTSIEQEKSLDEKLNLHLLSIRLQKDLIEDLKNLAGEDGMGYQPYIRQVLTHHVRNEKRKRDKQHLQLIRK